MELNQEYAQTIAELVTECQDIELLDFILVLLRETVNNQ